jgi:hypothetical protein
LGGFVGRRGRRARRSAAAMASRCMRADYMTASLTVFKLLGSFEAVA